MNGFVIHGDRVADEGAQLLEQYVAQASNLDDPEGGHRGENESRRLNRRPACQDKQQEHEVESIQMDTEMMETDGHNDERQREMAEIPVIGVSADQIQETVQGLCQHLVERSFFYHCG